MAAFGPKTKDSQSKSKQKNKLFAVSFSDNLYIDNGAIDKAGVKGDYCTPL
jgi:hypothetical protein